MRVHRLQKMCLGACQKAHMFYAAFLQDFTLLSRRYQQENGSLEAYFCSTLQEKYVQTDKNH